MSDFSSYLGASPYFPKVGIFADVFLDIPYKTWIEDAWVRPQLAESLASAEVTVHVAAEGEIGNTSWSLQVPDGKKIADGLLPTGDKDFTISLPGPRLWWPRGHGEAALYTLAVTVTSGGIQRDRRTIRFRTATREARSQR